METYGSQMDLFSSANDPFKISDKHLRVIELFAGIGAQIESLKRLERQGYLPKGVEAYRVVEIDKFAIASYNAIWGTNFQPTDIMKIHASDLGIVERENYLMTYSFPCTDLSNAGKMKGMSKADWEKGNSTRSGLLWEVERILKECGSNLPQILVCENVPLIISKKNLKDFNLWLDFLESIGYKNFYKILNAKEVGFPEPIPQNRERFFMISLLDGSYIFPNKSKLRLRLKDLLEEEVDEKFYLSQKMIDCFMSDGTGKYPRRERLLKNIGRENIKVGNSVTTLAGSRPTDNFVIEDMPNQRLRETLNENDVEDGDFIDTYNRSVQKGKAGTITTKVSSSNNMFVAERNEKEKLCDELIEDEKIKEGEMINHSRDGHIVSDDGITPTITTRPDELGVAVVDLKRGYPCTVKEEQESTDNVDIIGNYSKSEFNQTAIVGKNGIAPTVTENHGQVTAIAIKNATKQGYLLAEDGDGVDISSRMETHRGTVQKQTSLTLKASLDVGVCVKKYGNKKIDETLEKYKNENIKDKAFIDAYNRKIVDDVSGTIHTRVSASNGTFIAEKPKCIDGIGEKKSNKGTQYYQQDKIYDGNVAITLSTTCNPYYEVSNLRIRKLTPKECWRLMGFDDEAFDKAQKVNSNAQLYKQAGNSIVVNCLTAIFKEMC